MQQNRSKKKVLEALRSLGKTRPAVNDPAPEIWHFGILSFKARDPKQDREIILVCSAVIEQALEVAILARLPGLLPDEETLIFGDDGSALRDFGSKIRMAYALGIYRKNAKADLDVIRQIRNTFAHSRAKMSFDDEAVAHACELLTLKDRWPTMMSAEHGAREVFIQTCFQYSLYLITDPETSSEGADFVRDRVFS